MAPRTLGILSVAGASVGGCSLCGCAESARRPHAMSPALLDFRDAQAEHEREADTGSRSEGRLIVPGVCGP